MDSTAPQNIAPCMRRSCDRSSVVSQLVRVEAERAPQSGHYLDPKSPVLRNVICRHASDYPDDQRCAMNLILTDMRGSDPSPSFS
jgi:transcription-repair coupling factor (superfamily II helicase)